MKITGSLINSFYICKRKTWLYAHEIGPDNDHPFLELGRLNEENFYKRESKGFNVGNMKIDIVRKGGRATIIGEIKKSSKSEKATIMQLAFYLMKLEESGVYGRKKIKVKLTEEMKKELKETIKEIMEIIKMDVPPKKEKMRGTIFVFSNGKLKRRQNTIYFENESGIRKFIPVENTREIHIFGEVTINKEILEFLSKNEIILHF